MKLSPCHYRDLVKIFERAGWKFDRTRGDHLVYVKPGFLRPVIIPKYKTVPVFIIKNNLRTAHITNEEYDQLRKQ